MTPESLHEREHGRYCLETHVSCWLLNLLHQLAAAERAKGREECEQGHASIRTAVRAGRALGEALCEADHAALEAAAERRGITSAAGELCSHCKRGEPRVNGHHENCTDHSPDCFALECCPARPIWKALTGEGERPEDKG